MNTPQAVSIRYATNLLARGKNREFELLDIARRTSIEDEVCIGAYYTVVLKPLSDAPITTAAGIQPIQALVRALERAGVTFK